MNGRTGRAGHKQGTTLGAAGTIGPSSALSGSGAIGTTTNRGEVDEV
jgi:hypothetical protein